MNLQTKRKEYLDSNFDSKIERKKLKALMRKCMLFLGSF